MLKSLFEQLGVAFFGLITTALVVAGNVMLGHWTGFNLASFSINLIPVGAIAAGGLAASGYYIGAVYSHNRANGSLLILMVIVAGLAEIFTYWFDYATLEVDGQHIRNLVSFTEYLSYVVEHTHVSFVGRRVGYHSIGEIGWLNYLLATRNFIGFLVGGFFVYIMLRSKTVCRSCNLYLKSLKEGRRIFSDLNSAVEYMKRFAEQSNASSTMADLNQHNDSNEKAEPGSIAITSKLRGCPVCSYRVVNLTGAVYSGAEWKELDKMSISAELKPNGDIDSLPVTLHVDPSESRKGPDT